MRLLTLTHANLKTPLIVDAALLGFIYYSESQRCTIVMLSGGAAAPVLESVEEVKNLKEKSNVEDHEKTQSR